jgi:methionyl-tRNA synthetase
VKGHFDRVELSQALSAIWELVRRVNQYVQETEPWKLAKDPDAAAELDSTLYGIAEGLRVASVLLLPFMPKSSERVLAALGQPDSSLACARIGAVPGGTPIGELAQLFPRIEQPQSA